MCRWILLYMGILVTGLGAEELRVATFNIRYDAKGDRGDRDWEARRGLVMETIEKMNPDILGVQEALVNQKNYLADGLDEFEVVGVGRDDGKEKGEFSPVYFKRSKFSADPDDWGTIWLSATPEKAGSMTWGNEIPRICTWVRLLGKNGQENVYVFNTHWDHRSQPSREKAAELMLARVNARKHKDEPVVLLGDFNATDTNKAIKTLLMPVEPKGKPLRIALLDVHPDEKNRRTGHGYSGKQDGPFTIDHVVVDHHWVVKKAWIEYHHKEAQWPSDHFPVAAVLLRGGGGAEK